MSNFDIPPFFLPNKGGRKKNCFIFRYVGTVKVGNIVLLFEVFLCWKIVKKRYHKISNSVGVSQIAAFRLHVVSCTSCSRKAAIFFVLYHVRSFTPIGELRTNLFSRHISYPLLNFRPWLASVWPKSDKKNVFKKIWEPLGASFTKKRPLYWVINT